MAGPLEVQVTRGPFVESIHEVHAVVVRGGEVAEVFGDADRRVLPRSAVKMVQALPLVLTGAADALGLGDVELALACASHSAEPAHAAAVREWLTRADVDESHLECGTPRHRDSPVDHECSGKHAGFLSVARHLGVDPTGYIRPEHPVQQLVTAELAESFGIDLDPAHVAIDGCGIPVRGVGLGALATGMARFVDPPDPSTPRSRAAGRLAAAMRAQPFMVAGSRRLCTELMEDTDDLIAKVGAEGVYVAASIGGEWSVAVKAVDGAIRAAELAILHLVEASGRALSGRLENRRVVRSTAGEVVGAVRVRQR